MQHIHSEFYLHFIIAVKYADALLPAADVALHTVIEREVKSAGHRLLALGGAPDHLHIAVMLHPFQSPEAFINVVREASAVHLREQSLAGSGFAWQDDYAVFTFGRAELRETVANIMDQQALHATESFAEECRRTFRANGIEWDGETPFDPLIQRGNEA